jgi:hypothetical protein
MPEKDTTLSRLVCPDSMCTASRLRSSHRASASTNSAFARLSSGGAPTATFRRSPYTPPKRVRGAEGLTRTPMCGPDAPGVTAGRVCSPLEFAVPFLLAGILGLEGVVDVVQLPPEEEAAQRLVNGAV